MKVAGLHQRKGMEKDQSSGYGGAKKGEGPGFNPGGRENEAPAETCDGSVHSIPR